MSKEQADVRYEDSPVTYLFGLGDGSVVIDGHSAAMFINHSCSPNCETEEIGGRVWIKALRSIAPGEEITYDYCLYDGADDDHALCNCGTRSCRGTMYSNREMRKGKPAVKSRGKGRTGKRGA